MGLLYVDKDSLASSVLSFVLVTQTGLEMHELELQKQIEFEKIRLEQKKNEQERQMQRAKLEQAKCIELGREQLKFDTQEKEQERQYNLRMIELEIQNKTVKPQPFDFGVYFDITKRIRLSSPFQEKEVEKYFLRFKKGTENLKWQKEHWTLLLQSVITGKAREFTLR